MSKSADIEISEAERAEILRDVKAAGIGFAADEETTDGIKGWSGGSIWLVPTHDEPMENWKPIAERQL